MFKRGENAKQTYFICSTYNSSHNGCPFTFGVVIVRTKCFQIFAILLGNMILDHNDVLLLYPLHHEYVQNADRQMVFQVKIWFQNRRMKWRNSKERELIAHGGSREQTLPTKQNPNPDLSDPVPEGPSDSDDKPGTAEQPNVDKSSSPARSSPKRFPQSTSHHHHHPAFFKTQLQSILQPHSFLLGPPPPPFMAQHPSLSHHHHLGGGGRMWEDPIVAAAALQPPPDAEDEDVDVEVADDDQMVKEGGGCGGDAHSFKSATENSDEDTV